MQSTFYRTHLIVQYRYSKNEKGKFKMCQYAVVDLEMCNVPYQDRSKPFNLKNEIIQIGAVLLNEAYEICDTFMSYVHPEYGIIDSFITELTGITNKDTAGAPKCEDALSEFASWLPEDTKLVSWSPNDELQVRKELKIKTMNIPKLNNLLKDWVDCQKSFGDIMCSSKSYGLVDALNISSIDYDENIHDALVDAKNTALLFTKIEKEKDTEFKLNKYVSVGKNISSGYTPFADLLKDFHVEDE